MPGLEHAAAGIPSGGHHAEKLEVCEAHRAAEELCARDPLARCDPDRLGRARIQPQQLSPSRRRFKGQAIGRIGGNLAAADRRDHVARIDAARGRVSAKRQHGRQGEHVEARWERAEHRALCPAQPRRVHLSRSDEPVGAVTPHDIGRTEPLGPAAEHLEQERGQISTGQIVSQHPKQLGAAGRAGDPAQRLPGAPGA